MGWINIVALSGLTVLITLTVWYVLALRGRVRMSRLMGRYITTKLLHEEDGIPHIIHVALMEGEIELDSAPVYYINDMDGRNPCYIYGYGKPWIGRCKDAETAVEITSMWLVGARDLEDKASRLHTRGRGRHKPQKHIKR